MRAVGGGDRVASAVQPELDFGIDASRIEQLRLW
jgi:hypothetical protein